MGRLRVESNREGKLIVVLAGWLGCTQRILGKYADMYESLGYSTISIIAPPFVVVEASMEEESRSMQKLAKELLHRLASQENERRINVVFHSFSNGGCFLYEQLRIILQKIGGIVVMKGSRRAVLISIIGAIFDSCPAYYSGDQSDTEGLKRAMKYTSNFYQCSFWFQSLFRTSFQNKKNIDRAKTYWNRMRNNCSLVPELYCYSDVDDLAPPTKLLKLIEFRKKANPHVLSVLFEHSSHCCHLFTQPYMYSLVVSSFVDLCKERSTHQVGHRNML